MVSPPRNLSVFLVAFLQVCHVVSTCNKGHSPTCKALPGSPDWPNTETWASLNRTVEGRLLQPLPPAAVCHPELPNSYDAGQCAIVREEWGSYAFNVADPISIAWNQYSNDSCLPYPDTPCDPAGYPAYSVNATTVDHVKQTILFAKQHNVRLVVKSTGHDYQGRSIGPGALTLWIHHMQGLETHESFQPQGCDFSIQETSLTAQGATQMGLLYEELDKVGLTIVGGTSSSVGIGGHLTGGGHSVVAPKFGLAADQVLQMEVVTPQGEVVIANECQNQDIFWAMRGGGGSTFGVMTSVTTLTHPSPQLVSISFKIAAPKTAVPWFWDMIGYIFSQYPALDAKGLSGYSYTTTNDSVTVNGTSFQVDSLTANFVLFDTQDTADIYELWNPIFTHINQTWPEAAVQAAVTAFPSQYAWFLTIVDPYRTGGDGYVTSHLMDKHSMENAEAVGEAFKALVPPSGSGSAFLVSGNGTRNAKPRGGSNAVNPTWRQTSVYAVSGRSFPPLNPTARKETRDALNQAIEPLRELAPNMGSYLNENNPGVPNWQHDFWGSNYERLLAIKRAVDPDDVFWCHPCVGNERWRQDGYRVCRVGYRGQR